MAPRAPPLRGDGQRARGARTSFRGPVGDLLRPILIRPPQLDGGPPPAFPVLPGGRRFRRGSRPLCDRPRARTPPSVDASSVTPAASRAPDRDADTPCAAGSERAAGGSFFPRRVVGVVLVAKLRVFIVDRLFSTKLWHLKVRHFHTRKCHRSDNGAAATARHVARRDVSVSTWPFWEGRHEARDLPLPRMKMRL